MTGLKPLPGDEWTDKIDYRCFSAESLKENASNEISRQFPKTSNIVADSIEKSNKIFRHTGEALLQTGKGSRSAIGH